MEYSHVIQINIAKCHEAMGPIVTAALAMRNR